MTEDQKREKLENCLASMQEVIDYVASMTADSMNSTMQKTFPHLAGLFQFLRQTPNNLTEFAEFTEFIQSFVDLMLSAHPVQSHRFTLASLRMFKKRMVENEWEDDDLVKMNLLVNMFKVMIFTKESASL